MMQTNQSQILCPYCGHTQKVTPQCEQCHGLFEPLSRMATQIAMGPWFVRDIQQPFRPGCSFEILKKQIFAGKITCNTVIKGPPTKQFWAVAKNVPSVAVLLGVCHQCGHQVSSTDTQCSACHATLILTHTRNELGLQFPTAQAALVAQQQLSTHKVSEATANTQVAASSPSAPPASEDLLKDVLANSSRQTSHEKTSETPPATHGAGASAAEEPVSPVGQEQELDQQSRRLSVVTLVLVVFNLVVLVLLIMLWVGSRQEGGIAQTRPQPRRLGTTGSLQRKTLPQTMAPSQESRGNTLPLPQGSPQLIAVIVKARELESKDQIDQALVVLNQYARQFSGKELPFDLEVETERLQQKAARQKTESLFRTP